MHTACHEEQQCHLGTQCTRGSEEHFSAHMDQKSTQAKKNPGHTVRPDDTAATKISVTRTVDDATIRQAPLDQSNIFKRLEVMTGAGALQESAGRTETMTATQATQELFASGNGSSG